MKKLLFILLLFGFYACDTEFPKKERPTDWVDPFIGTAYIGHTHPAAQLPFGMVQVGPDTGPDKWEHCSGYFNEDSSIIGFSHAHLSGTGCPDMGDIMIMPVTGNVSFYRGDGDDTSTGVHKPLSVSTHLQDGRFDCG
jgi:putative alpha-1,2-mannosidase